MSNLEEEKDPSIVLSAINESADRSSRVNPHDHNRKMNEVDQVPDSTCQYNSELKEFDSEDKKSSEKDFCPYHAESFVGAPSIDKHYKDRRNQSQAVSRTPVHAGTTKLDGARRRDRLTEFKQSNLSNSTKKEISANIYRRRSPSSPSLSQSPRRAQNFA